MLDSRSYDGWRRLTTHNAKAAAADDPAALRQLIDEWRRLGDLIGDAMLALHGEPGRFPAIEGRPYSNAELAEALGVTRQAVSQAMARRRG